MTEVMLVELNLVRTITYRCTLPAQYLLFDQIELRIFFAHITKMDVMMTKFSFEMIPVQFPSGKK